MKIENMRDRLNADQAWIVLLILSIVGGWMGHQVVPGFLITLVVSMLTLIKGRLVVDHFMDLKGASPLIRRIVYGFCIIIPALMLLTYVWEALLIKLSQLVLGF